PEGPSLEGHVSGNRLRLAVSAGGDVAALADDSRVLVWKTVSARTARVLTEMPPPAVPGWGLAGKKWGEDVRTITWKFDEETENKGRMTHSLNLTTLEADSNPKGFPEVQGWVPSIRDWTITATSDKVLVVSQKGKK